MRTLGKALGLFILGAVVALATNLLIAFVEFELHCCGWES